MSLMMNVVGNLRGKIMIHRSYLLIFCFSAMAGCAGFTSHEAALPRPPLFIPWDIRPENSEIESDIEITKARNYHIDIDFEHFGNPNFLPKEILGGTAYEIVTNEPIPKVVPMNNLEETKNAYELADKGIYKWREKEPGIKMIFEVWVDKWDPDQKHRINIYHDTENTCCRDFGVDRAITIVTLRPGKYHIRVKKFDTLALPEDVSPALEVTFHPNAAVLERVMN